MNLTKELDILTNIKDFYMVIIQNNAKVLELQDKVSSLESNLRTDMNNLHRNDEKFIYHDKSIYFKRRR